VLTGVAGAQPINPTNATTRAQINERDQIPGIALTGYSQAGDQVRARQAGFVVHLTKPVAAPVLIEAILDVTGKARIGR